MYGLVHIGLRDLIKSSHSEQQWLKVLSQSKLSAESFISMQSYPDATTYQLVGAAVEVLGVSAESLLEDFGKHWVLHTGPDAYGSILDMSGDSLPELLENLDDLHVHLGNIMPNLIPPSFQCEDVTENSMLLHYRSSRQGLTPMVLGLLKGLGERFQTPCTASIISSNENDKGVHVIFAVQWDNT